jgi:hypothetical protein
MLGKNLPKERFGFHSHDASKESAEAEILVPEFQRHDKQ